MYSKIASIKGSEAVRNCEPVFTRGLPKNIVELANIVSQLNGLVPDEILLSLLPFIKDPVAAIDLLKEQKEETMQQQQRNFGVAENTPPEGDND